MRSLLPCFAMIALAGCGSGTEVDRESGNETAAVAPAQPAAVGTATSAAEGEALAQGQEEAATPFVWTGRFAVTPQLCQGGVWTIEREKIATAGETSCSVNAVADEGDKVVLTLACSAEGMDSQERWTLTRKGADGMNVSRATGTETMDVDLIRCG
jgi:hypothetical protein